MSQHLFRRAASSNFVSSAPRILSSRPVRPFHTTSPNMVVQSINSQSEWDALLQAGKPVLVDFYATWCGPCKVISPMFEQHSEKPEYKDAVNFAKVDVDVVSDVAAQLGIRAMPTFLLFKDGQKVKESIGADPKGLDNLVKMAL